MDAVKKPRRLSKATPRGDTDQSAPCAEKEHQASAPLLQDTAEALVQPMSRAAEAEAAALYADELADAEAEMLLREPEAPRGAALSVKLSHQLHTKLLRTARDEGVDLEGLVHELLAEGVTLRAWEIIERKSAMRGQAPGPNQPNQGGNRPFNNSSYGQQRQHSSHNRGASGQPGANGNRSQGGRGAPQGRDSRPPVANNAWMEDKAAFLEYVRNQEKRRR